ncbi:hypothetical protein JCM17823_15410 [Halorubrum gandharaense]
MKTFWRSFWIDRRTAFTDSRPSASDRWVSSSRALAMWWGKSVVVINLFDRARRENPVASEKAYNHRAAGMK